MNTPRDDLFRAIPGAAAAFTIRNATTRGVENGGRTLVGYPILFNQWTEISGWEGNFFERIYPTALNKTLADRGDKVVVLFNHGFDPAIGDKPLGKPTVQQPDERGMWAEVPLSQTSYNNDLLALIRDGAIWGQSFRFSVVHDEWNDEPEPSDYNPKGIPERTIRELKLYEWGPVTFPAYEATTVGVRSAAAYAEWRKNHIPDDYNEPTNGEPATTEGTDAAGEADQTVTSEQIRAAAWNMRKQLAELKGMTR